MRFSWCVLWLVACSYQPARLAAIDHDAANDDPSDPEAGTIVDDAPTGRDAKPLACPASYDVTIPSSQSRYRIITSNATFWTHRTTCNVSVDNTGTAGTHLAVLDTMAEAADLKAATAGFSSPPTNGRFYLGAIQEVGGGWMWITGADLPDQMWGVFNGVQQPDDGVDEDESNNDEQLAAIDPTVTYLIDVRGMTGYGAICECDGLAEDAVAIARIDADPNNPN